MPPATPLDWTALRLLALKPKHNLKILKHVDWPERLRDRHWLHHQLESLDASRYSRRQAHNLHERADQCLTSLVSINCDVIGYDHAHYPPLLKTIYDPPIVLLCRGDTLLLAQPQVAMVGSRKSTSFARSTAESLAQQLTGAGVHVTSGLALGIDQAAHKGALNAGPGSTLAVMANGPDLIYPQRHLALGEKIIASGGLLVTEHLPGTQPRPHYFPERNRIISGLSLGTLVVEAEIKSGSLVTARLALEQGREVFAVPGAISNPAVRGCHLLIKEGAGLIESVDDILKSLYLPLRDQVPTDSFEETPVLRLLGQAPHTVDQLAQALMMSATDLQIELTELEINGFVAREGARFVRLR